jgi:HSP20 family molecular chaperone IbpA
MSKTQEENTAPDVSGVIEQLMRDQLGDEAGGVGEVQQHEDENFYYYNISIKGLDRQSLNVEVKDGQILLKGQIRLANNAGGEMVESFNRSFPAPPNVDPQKVDIQNTQDTLTLKFPKIDTD